MKTNPNFLPSLSLTILGELCGAEDGRDGEGVLSRWGEARVPRLDNLDTGLSLPQQAEVAEVSLAPLLIVNLSRRGRIY